MMPDETWWRRVPIGEKTVSKAAEKLLEGRSIQIFPDMAWKDAFLEQVLGEVRDSDAGVTYSIFDGADMEPGASLIDVLAKQLGFEFNFDGTLATLVKLLQANSRCVWRLKNLCPKHLTEAHQIIRDLARQRAHISVILEDDTQAQVKSVFQSKLSVTRMDIQYYAWTLLLEQDCVPLLEYAAILCNELSGGDVERCAMLCERIHALLEDAGSVCDWLTGEELQQAVHLAQLRGIQPVIEEQRLKFIDRLGNRIERILPFSDEYGSQFTKPQEVELRHLIYFRTNLFLSQQELDLLNQLYDARNDLAHLKILPSEVIGALAALVEG